ncbi:MAG: putative toxin-antitoxin system toxin component, PIN family [Armatimonadota bacterium]
MRITLDSNILVRAVISPTGPALRLLDLVLGEHILVSSRFILEEVERVLLYPHIQVRYRTTVKEVASFVANLAEASHLVEPVIGEPLVLSDPEDDAVLYTAAQGNADVLCTRNLRHFDAPRARSFCAERGIRIMTDLDLLSELLGERHE